MMTSRSFIVEHAMEFGLPEAIMIHYFESWITSNRSRRINFHDGRTWSYNTAQALTEDFPFWSVPQIRRVLRSLLDQGILIRGNYNTRGGDQTLWYAFRDEARFLRPRPGKNHVTNSSHEHETHLTNSSLALTNSSVRSNEIVTSCKDHIGITIGKAAAAAVRESGRKGGERRPLAAAAFSLTLTDAERALAALPGVSEETARATIKTARAKGVPEERLLELVTGWTKKAAGPGVKDPTAYTLSGVARGEFTAEPVKERPRPATVPPILPEKPAISSFAEHQDELPPEMRRAFQRHRARKPGLP
jgi:hypothetical protein